ncbi:Pyrophosphate-energized vacuolar membrane proton pump [Hordeum vulgare]|nr:Pyrophosphate-energized vacuolar membrane proton pump [Hordeum vulgare]
MDDRKEEAIHVHIMKKRERRNMRTLTQEQNRAVREMAGLSPKEEKEDIDGHDSSDEEQIRPDPHRVFEWYFREKDDNGVGKGKDSRRWSSP